MKNFIGTQISAHNLYTKFGKSREIREKFLK